MEKAKQKISTMILVDRDWNSFLQALKLMKLFSNFL